MSNPIPPRNNAVIVPPPVSKRISMADYKKIQDIIDETIKVRARRYNYDLSAVLDADSDRHRHGSKDELLDDEEDIEKHLPKTTTGRPVSIIGAVNPQKLDGAPYIPAPVRNLKSKEGEVTPAVEEEAPEFRRAKFQ
jgi:hypothetical protein